MFGRKKAPETVTYDPKKQTPVIHASICTGEQVGGLKDIQTGRFEEIMVIRGNDDLEKFRKMVGREEIPKEY